MIEDTEELLAAIKELCERKFVPEGYYYVDKLIRKIEMQTRFPRLSKVPRMVVGNLYSLRKRQEV